MAVDFVFVQSTGYDFESGPCGTGDGGREDGRTYGVLRYGIFLSCSCEAAKENVTLPGASYKHSK